MDALVVTDNDSVLIDPYWLGIILVQTYAAIKKDQIENEDIDDLIEFFEENQWRLEFTKKYIKPSSFDIFYKYCCQAMESFQNTVEAKAYWIDYISKKEQYRRNMINDYLSPVILKEILDYGEKEGYLNNSKDKNERFQKYINFVLLWWVRFLGFLKENYGKPKQEQNN